MISIFSKELSLYIMGLDVVLEFEDPIQAGPRPKTFHSSEQSRTKVDERDIKGLLRSKYYNLRRLDGDSRELRLSNTSSPRRKSMPARPHVVYAKDGEVVKRGSVYQSSKEVSRMRHIREGREDAESSHGDGAFLSFEIVDSSPQPLASEAVEFPKQKRSHLATLDTELPSQPVDNVHSVPTKSIDFLDLSFRDLPEECINVSSPCYDSAPPIYSINGSLPETELGKGLVEAQKSVINQKICSKADTNNVFSGRGAMSNLPKSFSAKAVMSNSPCQSERETVKASPKSRFRPIKRMLDPIMKSKSQRNPSLTETETVGNTVNDPSSIGNHRVFRKSLLSDFSKVTEKVENDSGCIGRDQVSVTVSSPAHLHAILKLESNHGVPSYEFAVDDPGDTLSAKTWRSDSAFSWVYTFHRSKKKNSSISGRGSKERHGQSPPIIGQMQVSCYLCSEVSDMGSLDNSTVTEFILYDIAQARRSFAVEGPRCLSDSTQPPTFTIADSLAVESPLEANSSPVPLKCQPHCRRPSSDLDLDPSTSYPWAPVDLHRHLESAAIVIQIPFNKKETKGRQVGEEIRVKGHQSLSGSTTDQVIDTLVDCMSPAYVKVVTPSGTHGLPSTEESGPSSLLDRWRLGGGCDCGGWDMACPIVVFENPYANDAADCSEIHSQQPIALFVKGRKEKIPALSIIADGKGQYSVNFHAQLSALQAFSICIAILHSSEAASALGQEERYRLYSNSLKLLLGEEVRNLIEAVEEEKRKVKKRVEKIPPSFVLDPPFSPMGR